MAHAQKPNLVFRRNGRVHLNRRGRQFSRLLAAEVCASAVVMLDTPCSEVVWRVLATQFIRQFPLHFPSRASPCAITFQLYSTSHRTIAAHTDSDDFKFNESNITVSHTPDHHNCFSIRTLHMKFVICNCITFAYNAIIAVLFCAETLILNPYFCGDFDIESL